MWKFELFLKVGKINVLKNQCFVSLTQQQLRIKVNKLFPEVSGKWFKIYFYIYDSNSK